MWVLVQPCGLRQLTGLPWPSECLAWIYEKTQMISNASLGPFFPPFTLFITVSLLKTSSFQSELTICIKFSCEWVSGRCQKCLAQIYRMIFWQQVPGFCILTSIPDDSYEQFEENSFRGCHSSFSSDCLKI